MKLLKSVLGLFALLAMLLLITTKSIYAGVVLLIVAAIRIWILCKEIKYNQKLINERRDGYWEVPRTEANAWLFKPIEDSCPVLKNVVPTDEGQMIDCTNESIKESVTESQEVFKKQ